MKSPWSTRLRLSTWPHWAHVCDVYAGSTKTRGTPAHVHLLVHYPPKVALSRLVGSLKGVSARRLRQEFPGHIRTYLWGDHFWSPSYFAASWRRTARDHQGVHREPEATRLRATVQTRAPVKVTPVMRSASSRA
ncbi:IS200/IS605 family transposase [Streptomyces canus]|uniref:IS200/IS605 family transposase n=1 Tax=Streptomyces canus TaxID=58343 RepID=UPI0039A6FC4C